MTDECRDYRIRKHKHTATWLVVMWTLSNVIIVRFCLNLHVSFVPINKQRVGRFTSSKQTVNTYTVCLPLDSHLYSRGNLSKQITLSW